MSENMKITARLFERVLNSVESDADVPRGVARKVLLSGLDSLGIKIEEPCFNCEPLIARASSTRMDGTEGIIPCNHCNAYVDIKREQGRARFTPVEYVWIERTWADVRQNDVVRPVGNESAAALVVKIGPVTNWHTHPDNSRVSMEWSARKVTLRPLTTADITEDADDFTPAHGMTPDAPVEIQVTRSELTAIEVCGGWSERVSVSNLPD